MATTAPVGRLIEDCRFRVWVTCADCGHKLNDTVPMTAQELRENWTRLVLGSGMQCGACPNGCCSTYSDLNINTRLTVRDADTDAVVVFQVLQWLAGHFYADDYGKVCRCKPRPESEVYYSARYPAMHGPCGCWLKPYKRPTTR